MRHYLHAAIAMLLFWSADILANQDFVLMERILTGPRVALILAACGGMIAASGWPGLEQRGPQDHQAEGVLWRRKMKAQIEEWPPPPPPTEFERPSNDPLPTPDMPVEQGQPGK